MSIQRLVARIGAGAICLAAVPASAAVYDLKFDSLPTAQGWTYFDSGTADQFFSVSNGVLRQNSNYAGRAAIFARTIDLQDGQAFKLIVDMKVIGVGGHPFGVGFGIITPNDYAYFGMNGAGVPCAYTETSPLSCEFASHPTAYAAGQYNLYEIAGVTGRISVKVNGIEVLSNYDAPGLNESARLYLGDGTASGGGVAEFRRFTFLTDADATAAVPEPATWATMLVGFGLVGGAMRQRRRVFA